MSADPFVRGSHETLSEWIGRLYDSRTDADWTHLDSKVREASDAGLPVPPIAETLWFLRQLEQDETPNSSFGDNTADAKTPSDRR